MTSKRKNRLIISNDDGWVITNTTGPSTPKTVADKMVATYAGSPIGGVSWCVGSNETYEFETQVGERTGDAYEYYETPRETWLHRNLNSFIESCGGPLTEINRQFAEAGIDVFPSMRMNTHYDIAYSSPEHGQFRRDHPEWLIGQPYEEIPFPTLERAIARGVDYKFPGVREHMLKIATELIERFDVAGIELDYFRHPAFFRIEEAYANRYLMTDFIRQVRRRLDEVGKDRGKHLDLLVRVPSSPYDSKRIGLDIELWIKEGLVDIVAAGGGFLPFEQPIREFVEIANGADCLIYGSLESMRWSLDEEVLYALAARFWEAGVDGLYLFNYFNIPNEWKRRVLGNMVDRDKLPRLDKQYELDYTIDSKHAHGGAFRYASAWASLPVIMEETQPGGGSALTLDIADDVEGAKLEGVLESCSIGLGVVNLAEDDELDVRLNGRSISRIEISYEGWTCMVFDGKVYHTTMSQVTEKGKLITFDATDIPVIKGANELIVRFIKGKSPRFKPVTLKEVRLNIRYR
jgi:hypothetical protein